eukprot:CAMPEP_0172726894 /NCGR_PEP_ID=MMETSP1074-20121228/91370_1 /TAXON_ID=2916 /ORGANISM="Ceratium fusus, Strain PA161109" /LENGTH=291 /DNA_ID=CAMNT_0013553995 /DNA_START=9 /DNA_END=884 /DNA_ORIENTATION=+
MTLLQGMCLVTFRQLVVTASENLQRYAQRRVPPRRVLNILGVLLGVVTTPLDMIAYSVAPQSVLAPFGMLQLLLNFGVAHFHGDVFRKSDVLATAVVIAGSFICLWSGAPSKKHPFQLPQMETLQIYSVCVLTCCAFLGCLLAAMRKVGGRTDAVLHCLLGGTLGSTVLVSSKVLAASWIAEDRTFASVALACVPPLTLGAVHLSIINRGFGRHPLTFMSPGLSVVGLLANVTTGCLLYSEVPVEPLYFAVGVTVLCYGVIKIRTVNNNDADQCDSTCNSNREQCLEEQQS